MNYGIQIFAGKLLVFWGSDLHQVLKILTDTPQSLQALDKCQLGDIMRAKSERLDAPGEKSMLGINDKIVVLPGVLSLCLMVLYKRVYFDWKILYCAYFDLHCIT